MAKNPKFKHFYKAIKAFRKEFPTDLPVIVRRKRLKNHFGYCCQGKNYYYIYIDDRLGEELAVYFLGHEWAHARTFDIQLKDHGVAWSKENGKIYAYYEKTFLE